jgi:hypothetical protein
MSLKHKLTKIACLSCVTLLASCALNTEHTFTGQRRIDQKDHWIELSPGLIARDQANKWYQVGAQLGYRDDSEYVTAIDCFTFTVDIKSDERPRRFEILRMDVLCNNRWPLKLYRLPKEQEKLEGWDDGHHEIWTESPPSLDHPFWTIPQGDYQFKVHYRLGDAEYDAVWRCVYKTKVTL